MSSARRLVPWIWTGLIAGLAVALVVFAAGEFETHEIAFAVVFLTSILIITALGSLVMVRQPGNRIAWLLHAIAVGLLFTIWADTVIRGGAPASPGVADWLAAVVGTPAGLTAMFSIALLLYLFPSGQFLTPRWRWAGWLAAVVIPATWILSLFVSEVGDVWDEDASPIVNPIGFVPVEALDALLAVVPVLLLVTLLGGVVSMVVRFRRSDLLIRTQIKWVLFASVITLVSSFFAFSGLGLVSDFLTMVLLTAIPIAVATAVVRYKIFEIDRLISRTVSYTFVVLALGAVFAALTWLPSFVAGGMNQDGTTGSTPPVIVAASTLAVAALFNPVRKRVQRRVDRRFNRSRYQSEALAEGFSAQLQESLSVEEVAEAWTQTVQDALQPEATGIWINKTPVTPQRPDSDRP